MSFAFPRWIAGPAALIAALAAVLQPASASAAARPADCAASRALVCSTVTVPLDRGGRVAGSVPLHVEVLAAPTRPARGVIVLLAGGPGQASARTYDLADAENAAFYRFLFPGYTLVTYDARGTGRSGLLRCPALDDPAASEAPDQTELLIASCAASIGPARDFYGTADHVEDLEAVRRALGVERIAILGVSYGTKLALAYAAAHPEHTARLILDSVLPTAGPDLFAGDELRSLPATLAGYCPGNSCAVATNDFAGDVVDLANSLAATPLEASVPFGDAQMRVVRLGAADLLDLVIGADLSPGVAADLPAAVRAAREADPLPLLRLYTAAEGSPTSPADMSVALFLATTCRDGSFPWQPDAPIEDRATSVAAAVSALPAGSFGPFGDWAQALGVADVCLGWPSPAGGASLSPQPLPDVPALALSGSLDLRTPTAGAASVVAQLPQSHLLVVPGVGHSVLTMDPSGCAQLAVRRWMLGSAPPSTCRRAKQYLAAVAAYPSDVPSRLDASQTRRLVATTVHEAEAMWLVTAGSGGGSTIPGLFGGRLTAKPRSFVLDDYTIAPDVTVSGSVTVSAFGPPLAFKGLVRVNGRAAVHGLLRIAGEQLRGTLGG